MHRERPAVIAEALPLVEHVGRVGGGQVGNAGEPCKPTLPAAVHAAHLRLLQHDLADPDLVGVSRAAPRQVAVELAPLLADLLAEVGKRRQGIVCRHPGV